MRHPEQRAVHDRRVLTFDESDTPQLARQRKLHARQLLGYDARGLLLLGVVDRREYARYCDRTHAAGTELPGSPPNLRAVDRIDRAAVVVVAAIDDFRMAADDLDEVLRPSGQRPNAQRRRCGEPQDPHAAELLSFHEGVREMSRADHHAGNLIGGCLCLCQHVADCPNNAGPHVRRSRSFVLCQNLASAQQHRIRVGSAYVDADLQGLRHRSLPSCCTWTAVTDDAARAGCRQSADGWFGPHCGYP